MIKDHEVAVIYADLRVGVICRKIQHAKGFFFVRPDILFFGPEIIRVGGVLSKVAGRVFWNERRSWRATRTRHLSAIGIVGQRLQTK